MTEVVIASLIISFIVYLYIGFSLGRQTKGLGDLIPLVLGKVASVKNEKEFSASTVATTISLATIIIAYFELAGYFGFWLFWTVITTGIGLALVSWASKRIWFKLSEYDHRPTLHEFLGYEFNSPSLAFTGALCTSFGFLLIFATELIVGSRFLASLIPAIPEWVTVIVLSTVGFLYTVIGGFRAVIKTDQIQMKFIWGFIFILGAYYIFYMLTNGGVALNVSKIPVTIIDFSWKEGLGSFLIGIAIMNIPTHISNMSIWQRISGSENAETVQKGLRNSIWSASISWGLLVLLACFAYMIVSPSDSKQLLTDLIKFLGKDVLGLVIVFFIVLGLYGAMLSTASTNLIVVAHTIYEDLLSKVNRVSLKERLTQSKELKISRFILLLSALFAIGLVEGLKLIGFSIADLVFAIYGGQLALFPPIIVALYGSKEKLKSIGKFASFGVILGFIFGWGSAIIGKIIGNGNLIFLAPGFSIGVSFLCLLIGYVVKKK